MKVFGEEMSVYEYARVTGGNRRTPDFRKNKVMEKLRPFRAVLIASPKDLKSYRGTGLFAIFIHPITFYCSPFFLDMSTLFYQLAKIIPKLNKKYLEVIRLDAYNYTDRG